MRRCTHDNIVMGAVRGHGSVLGVYKPYSRTGLETKRGGGEDLPGNFTEIRKIKISKFQTTRQTT